jgi:hypothetical protein
MTRKAAHNDPDQHVHYEQVRGVPTPMRLNKVSGMALHSLIIELAFYRQFASLYRTRDSIAL